MEQITTPATMQAWSDERRRSGRRIVLVPTMGALHDGHLRLIDVAHDVGDAVIVSLFVNPLQFNRPDDFERYPRPIEADAATCAAAGVHSLYAPTASSMYPAGFETHVEPGSLAEPLEGAGRPGHFRGVTTVVAKLFHATRPHVAVFGRKDFQQLAIVRRMVDDLDMGIEIVGVATVREADGVALSSRNRRLSPEQRAAAVCVPAALSAVCDAHRAGERNASSLRSIGLDRLSGEPLARVEYLEVVDPTSLVPVDDAGVAVVAAAVWFGDVRLIDNIELGAPTPRD